MFTNGIVAHADPRWRAAASMRRDALVEDQFRRARDRFYDRNTFDAEEVAEVDAYPMAEVLRRTIGDDVGVQSELFHSPPPGFFDAHG